ncbi:MAG TPA: GNAT family N-acetyltransferase [Pirellulales bacterium]|jgi:hypothetical protein|nr:GNAT family N-acetyltransferase [Pirellulales bacterium]
MSDEAIIRRAQPGERPVALELTFSTLLPQPNRAQHIANLLADSTDGDHRWCGLMVARRAGAIVGAMWANIEPQQAANVWPPRLTAGETDELAQRLLAAGLAEIEVRGIKLAQALVAPSDADDQRRLSAAGFRPLAELVYLMSSRPPEGDQPPASPLEFQRYVPADRARMEAIIDRTYIQSLDCPGLDGLRSGGEALKEYRGSAVSEPAHWFFVRSAGADIGCLLLAEHPELDQFELVYMGLVSEARGQARGGHVVRYAQWLAGRVGRRHLVLAVDSANAPALGMYEAAGMIAWDRRKVLLRSWH